MFLKYCHSRLVTRYLHDLYLIPMTVPTRFKSKITNIFESQTDRFSKAGIFGTSLHIEGLDLYRKSTQQDWLINGVCHQSLRSFWDILRLNKTSLTFTA